MAVKLRLSRKGRKKAPFYHIVVADSRSPRDGKFIERIGGYNPMTKPATIELDRNAAYEWLSKGAQPTDTVKAILRFKGVYYKKHLMRGVSKGAMTVEQADVLYQNWIDAKDGKVEARKAETIAELEAFRKMISGEAKAKVIVADESTKEAAVAFRETVAIEESPAIEATLEPEVTQVVEEAVAEVEPTPVVEESPAAQEAPVAEELPVAEEVPVAEESPVTEESPVAEEVPVAEESPVTDEAPVAEESLAAQEAPVVEELPVTEESPVAEEVPVREVETPSEAVAEVESPSEEEESVQEPTVEEEKSETKE